MSQNRDEAAKLLRKALKGHAQNVNPSSQALFSINRGIKEAELPEYSGYLRKIWRPIKSGFRPAYALAAVMLLVVGGLASFLITNNVDSPSTQVEVASPAPPEGGEGSPEGGASNNEGEPDGTESVDITIVNNNCLNTGDSSEPNSINVYFVCNGDLISRQRFSANINLESALKLLLEGPTQSEIQNGFTSGLVDLDGTLIKDVQVGNGRAVVDFSSSLPESTSTLSQLNATVFDFPDIHLVEYRIEGSCDSFIRRVSSGGCKTFLRNGSRSGSSGRYVVPVNQAVVGRRTIHTCPNEARCRAVETIDREAVYHFTGQKSNSDSGEWLEVVTPSGQIGWLAGNSVSVQRETPTPTGELFQIVESLSTISEEQLNLYPSLFSSTGVYGSYFSSAPYGYFHIIGDLDISSRLNLSRILKNIEGVEIADLIPPTPILDNLEYLTLSSNLFDVNAYFDFRNGYPELIGFSFHHKTSA